MTRSVDPVFDHKLYAFLDDGMSQAMALCYVRRIGLFNWRPVVDIQSPVTFMSTGCTSQISSGLVLGYTWTRRGAWRRVNRYGTSLPDMPPLNGLVVRVPTELYNVNPEIHQPGVFWVGPDQRKAFNKWYGEQCLGPLGAHGWGPGGV